MPKERDPTESRRLTARRRALQPLWSQLDRWLGPELQGGALLAVSGGPDSAALLEACATWPRRGSARLEVACVDHGVRPEAASEACGVKARAQALGLVAHVLTATTVRADEASLRTLRYRLLWDCARERCLGAVVTAHHQGDDAEGLLLDLLGLGGGRGGAGMPHYAPQAGGILVRPFLDLGRSVLLSALRAVDAPPPLQDPDD
ncbi:MAG: tRNA lysidine(34) synthetase, partial [Myxococcota bacterium]